VEPVRDGDGITHSERRAATGVLALSVARGRSDRGAVWVDSSLARRRVHSGRDARRVSARPDISRNAAATRRRAGIACAGAVERFAARVPEAGAANDHHRHLQHRARDDVLPADADPRHQPQRGDQDRRARGRGDANRTRANARRRSRLPVADEFLLAIRAGRRWGVGGAGLADAQPRAAGADPARRRPDHQPRRPRVDEPDAAVDGALVRNARRFRPVRSL